MKHKLKQSQKVFPKLTREYIEIIIIAESKSSSLVDGRLSTLLILNEGWMRREKWQHKVRQRWTWEPKEKDECMLNHLIECSAILYPQDDSAALLLWKHLIPAATVSTEDTGNLYHLTPITSLYFHPVQHTAEIRSCGEKRRRKQ